MNLLRVSVLATMLSCSWMTTAQAEQTVLPTLKLLAEPELRQETGIVPFQEDLNARKALQHIVMRSQWDAQNFKVDSDVVANVEYQPKPAEPNLSSLSPFLQSYVMAIADGLRSSDPTQGLYVMLQPYGIDRGNINAVRQNGIHIQLTMPQGQLHIPVSQPPKGF